MTIADLHTLHTYARLGLVVWSTIFLVLLTRSLALGYIADYGPPWRRKPGANGRAALDLDVVVREGLFAILGLLSTYSALRRIGRGEDTELSLPALLSTGYLLVFAVFSYRIWRKARAERLKFGPYRRARRPTAEGDEP